jgi:hypothetical protein
MNSVYLYSLLTLTDFNSGDPDEDYFNLRNRQGWLLVILCFVIVLVNIGFLLYKKCIQLRKFIKKRKERQKKYQIVKKHSIRNNQSSIIDRSTINYS